MEWPVLRVLNRRRIPPAVLAVGVVSLLTDVSSESNSRLQRAGSIELAGLPSPVRMSADSSLVATTTFVGGNPYAQVSLSTKDIDSAQRDEPRDHPVLEDNSRRPGMTFAEDDDTFYATAASGSTTWLMRGSTKEKSMVSLRTDAECPSLSPDQARIAYKKRPESKARGMWRLAVLDLRTGQESLLAETRSVDDQAEWLDGNRLLDRLPGIGSEVTTSEVWVVPAFGTGATTVFIPEASSPAVVR